MHLVLTQLSQRFVYIYQNIHLKWLGLWPKLNMDVCYDEIKFISRKCTKMKTVVYCLATLAPEN